MAANIAPHARLWAPFRALQDNVNAALYRREPGSIHDLELSLRKHKPDFISLLKVPPKNAASRDLVLKASTEGLQVQGTKHQQTFSQQFVAEALILSDLFSMDELAAVELLIAGENQLQNYPGLTRGLVAVILFYDGQRSLVSSLRSLLQAREGHTWTLGLTSDLVRLVSTFTDQLLQDKLVHKILDLLQNMDLAKEVDKLQKQRALGVARHRKQVTDLYKEIQHSLAECLFCLACQQPLNKTDTLRLLAYLRTDSSLGPAEALGPVSLCLLMTLAACFDLSPLEQEEAEGQSSLPVVNDESYLQEVHQEIRNSPDWATAGLQSVARFAWGLMLRKLSQCQNFTCSGDWLEEDEQLVDMAIEGNVFEFITNSVIPAQDFHNEEFYVRRVHVLVTDFILQMPLKVKELRNHGDETARIILAHQAEGYEPPAQRRDFQYLMELIGDLYRKDPLGLELALEYWCPMDSPMTISESLQSDHPAGRSINLYKFVRLAGDLLPAPLFVHYLHMLTGLASSPQGAHNAFHLLKTNGVSSGGAASTVSWDHFFESLQRYYASMRREIPSNREMAGGAPFRAPPARAITPQELDGLCALMQLTKTVAEQNELCRLALYDNQHWSVVITLFGLLGCSVALTLKKELLLLLAALAKTPLVATNIWQTLEASQTLTTIPSELKSGIQVELEEVESRGEEYPVTQAFLQLLNVLTDIPIPSGLGAGLRAPGFEPYLEYLIHSILLKFNSRAYKEAGKKWDVVTGVLNILYKLLRDYEVREDDFRDEILELPDGSIINASKPPGLVILLMMLNDSPVFRVVMRVLEDGISLFETYAAFPGRTGLEKATLLCLRVLMAAAQKQEEVETHIRNLSAPFMVTSIDKLLLSINPKTRRPDYLVTVTKFVIFNTSLVHHALTSVKILSVVCRLAPIQVDLINLFTADAKTSQEVLHGFVECFDCDYAEEGNKEPSESVENEDTWSVGKVQNATRQHLVRLLLQCLQSPAPSLAHWLLGFQVHKSVAKTILQDPGVMGQPKTCLHAIMSLLQLGVDGGSGPQCLHDAPTLAELAYQLIYKLCAQRDTSTPTLRYLRTTYDFLVLQLRYLPFEQTNYKASVIPHQSWLMKTAAIELRLTSLNRQRSHCQRLIQLLLGDEEEEQTLSHRPMGLEDKEFYRWDLEQSHLASTALTGKQMRSKLLSILDTVNFSYQQPEQLDLKFFNPTVMDGVLSSHEVTDADGQVYYDVRALRRLLMSELDSQQGPMMAAQRPLIMEEIQRLLEWVVERNAQREYQHQQRQNFEAWRQVVEILLTACPEDLLAGERRQTVIFGLLQELLCKVADDEIQSESTVPVSGVVLTLMANLRQCFLTERLPLSDYRQAESGAYTSLLDHSAMGSSSLSQPSPWKQSSSSKTLFATSLQVVLKGLMEYILSSGSGMQRVRVNLYGALLFYLQIAQKPVSVDQPAEEQGMERILSGKETEYLQLCRENLSTISGFGEALMEVVCRDACDGHDIGRMLALSVLDSIMAEDWQQQWLSYIVTKGYLQHLIKSLPSDNAGLRTALTPNPAQLRPLYIFQSKMSMFTRLGQTAEGARNLLRCGVLPALASLTALDMYPDRDSVGGVTGEGEEGFVPSPLMRYRQLLSASLRLCLAILTSLGLENREAATQVMFFVISHGDVFNQILRNRSPSLDLPAMRELSLVTAVLARANCQKDLASEFLDIVTAQVEFSSYRSRLHRQMLALLPRFCFSNKFMKQLNNLSASQALSSDGKDVASDLALAYQEIASNISAFCRAVVTQSSPTYQYSRILFGPSLEEASASDLQSSEESSSALSLSVYKAPGVGVLVYQLRQCALHFTTTFQAHRQYQQKLASIQELSTEDLKQLSEVRGVEKLSSQQRQTVARRRLMQLVRCKDRELQHLAYMLENCLFLLWRHLEYYLLRCVPAKQQPLAFQTTAHRQHQMRHLQDDGWTQQGGGELEGVGPELEEAAQGVSRADLELLKQMAPQVVSETLLKKVLDINQSYGKSHTHYSFTEAVVRRIRRLLRLHTGSREVGSTELV